jgi:hypothetical protein
MPDLLKRNRLFCSGLVVAVLGFALIATLSRPVGIAVALVGGLLMAAFKHGDPRA